MMWHAGDCCMVDEKELEDQVREASSSIWSLETGANSSLSLSTAAFNDKSIYSTC